ncbi:stage V sporulation protein AD [Fervidicella metallireducens AeB]|uniref:Stage V sporulation protein AD n=1 Tax=Fervidicella metallireducens AeB TaxID=1403537 RepID=A0A017RUL7_9CLOT|nr:stage V sporulation protein AD [Fervidicella metallireducens]EYE88094.1 stage V sporulation protein AD [Fervidicella metallireducens AeB]
MAEKKLGLQTVKLKNPPSIISTSSIVGPKESEGPLREYFDIKLEDDLFGEKSWEKAESKMVREAVRNAIEKAKLKPQDIDYYFGGDLLNQIISSSFAARELQIPFFGLYGACSTMTESLSLGAMNIDGGYSDYVVAATSSHFCSAERQFRFPLEHGNQRPPTSQWTVTGSGAAVLAKKGNGPYITYVTTGRVMDFGIKDANNMGAAMAPAAADTILRHFKDTGFDAKDYDLIITGDLGKVGRDLTVDLVFKNGYDISSNFTDCGVEIFDLENQDVHAGGSGCGCSAVVFCGYLYNQLLNKNLKKVLLISTGALLSPTSTMQGESIPGIAHGVTIERMG